MLLRESTHRGSASFDALAARARKFRGSDLDGDRAEFIKLSELGASLRSLERTSLESRR